MHVNLVTSLAKLMHNDLHVQNNFDLRPQVLDRPTSFRTTYIALVFEFRSPLVSTTCGFFSNVNLFSQWYLNPKCVVGFARRVRARGLVKTFRPQNAFVLTIISVRPGQDAILMVGTHFEACINARG